MRIWVDLENLPDVLFFSPVLRALETRGHTVFVTARREKDLPALCAQKGWKVGRTVGRHHGRSRAIKIVGGLARASGLALAVAGFKPGVLVNFASRPAILAAAALRIPIFTFLDYEHVALPLVGALSTRVCVPEAVSLETLGRAGIPERKVLTLPATKEDVYAADFEPSPLRAGLGVPGESPFALLRPPAVSAHYHDSRSELIFDALLERIERNRLVHARVLCRSDVEARRLASRFPGPRIRHLDSTGNGLDLIWNADIVVSGGGTMTREAAALGVAAYSIFTGAIGAVDRRLFDEGRIVHVDSLAALDRIRFEPAASPHSLPARRPDLVDLLARGVEEAAG